MNIRLIRGIGGIRVGSVISLKFAEIELAGISAPEALTRLSGLTGVEPGVGATIGSSETCPIRVTGEISPDIPYRICGA